MALCPTCSKEVAEGAAVCKHCGAQIGIPKRPVGVTIIAVLCFILGLSWISSGFALSDEEYTLLGVAVSRAAISVYEFVMGLVIIYCGIGFMRLASLSLWLFLGYALFTTIDGSIDQLSMLSEVAEELELQSSALYTLFRAGIVGLVIGAGLWILVLLYLFRRKSYFVRKFL